MAVFHAIGTAKVEALLDADQKKRFNEVITQGNARYVWDNLKAQMHK
jgi:hypothetical protein